MTGADYIVVFDGGSRGNPGRGYGSYAVTTAGRPGRRIERLTFPGRVTSNEAEYDTLIAALAALPETMRTRGQQPGDCTVEVRGDSLLVISQVNGWWKARKPRMQQRRDRVLALVKQFKSVSFVHQARADSVGVLGH
jgi:ribonuclease HI